MEHVGERGVQVSVGTEMEACDQATVARNQFCSKSMEKPSRKPCNHRHRIDNWQALEF